MILQLGVQQQAIQGIHNAASPDGIDLLLKGGWILVPIAIISLLT